MGVPTVSAAAMAGPSETASRRPRLMHALASGGRADMSGVANVAHPCAWTGSSRLKIVASTSASTMREEGLRGAITRAETRQPEDFVDFYRVRVLAVVAGERARTDASRSALDGTPPTTLREVRHRWRVRRGKGGGGSGHRSLLHHPRDVGDGLRQRNSRS